MASEESRLIASGAPGLRPHSGINSRRPCRCLFGQTAAQISYQGLAPGSVGLYQFNVTVPDIADSNAVPLVFTQNGVPESQTRYTAVHH